MVPIPYVWHMGTWDPGPVTWGDVTLAQLGLGTGRGRGANQQCLPTKQRARTKLAPLPRFLPPAARAPAATLLHSASRPRRRGTDATLKTSRLPPSGAMAAPTSRPRSAGAVFSPLAPRGVGALPGLDFAPTSLRVSAYRLRAALLGSSPYAFSPVP